MEEWEVCGVVWLIVWGSYRTIWAIWSPGGLRSSLTDTETQVASCSNVRLISPINTLVTAALITSRLRTLDLAASQEPRLLTLLYILWMYFCGVVSRRFNHYQWRRFYLNIKMLFTSFKTTGGSKHRGYDSAIYHTYWNIAHIVKRKSWMSFSVFKYTTNICLKHTLLLFIV